MDVINTVALQSAIQNNITKYAFVYTLVMIAYYIACTWILWKIGKKKYVKHVWPAIFMGLGSIYVQCECIQEVRLFGKKGKRGIDLFKTYIILLTLPAIALTVAKFALSGQIAATTMLVVSAVSGILLLYINLKIMSNFYKEIGLRPAPFFVFVTLILPIFYVVLLGQGLGKMKVSERERLEALERARLDEKLEVMTAGKDYGFKHENKKKRYFSFKAVQTEIQGYGFSYSLSSFMKSMCIYFVLLIGISIFYKLKVELIIMLAIFVVLLIPNVIVAQFRFLHEQKRFKDSCDYMQNIIYAFKKKPKIINALIDVEESFKEDDQIKANIQKTIAYIENGVYGEDLYREAFSFISRDYGCSRMTSLHNFLIKIEMQGGAYNESINVLLDDIKQWMERTYVLQQERQGIKSKIMIAIMMSLGICGVLGFMMPKDFDITKNIIYQISSTACVAVMAIVYVISQSKLNGSWLVSDEVDQKRIKKDYEIALHGDVKALRKKNMPLIILMVAAGAYCGLCLKNMNAVLGCGVATFIFYTQPANKVKAAKNRSLREINKAFPGWLRDLAVNLQKETVQVAIANSVEKAPLILVDPLNEMLEEMDADPTSMMPYANFLHDFDLPDISSAMKMLYSLNATGREEAVTQINALVSRNNALLEKAERMKNEDSTAIAGFLVAVPMGIGVVKMLVDMILMMVTFMGQLSL